MAQSFMMRWAIRTDEWCHLVLGSLFLPVFPIPKLLRRLRLGRASFTPWRTSKEMQNGDGHVQRSFKVFSMNPISAGGVLKGRWYVKGRKEE